VLICSIEEGMSSTLKGQTIIDWSDVRCRRFPQQQSRAGEGACGL